MNRLLVIFLILSAQTFGQSKRLIFPAYFDGDTTEWLKSRIEPFMDVGLEDLATTTEKLRIRISTDNKIVEIWSNDSTAFSGQQVLYTSSFDPENKKPSVLYSIKKSIGADTSKMIFSIIDSLRILRIPEQDSVKNWSHGLDGYVYIVEYSDQTTFSSKSYWTPSAFKQIPEALAIYTIDQEIDKLLNLSNSFDLFMRTLPADNCYHIGGISILCPGKKSRKKRKR